MAICFMVRDMTGKRGLTMQHMATFLKTMSEEQLARRLAPDFDNLPKLERESAKVSWERARQRWAAFPEFAAQAEILLEQASAIENYQGNIENFIGELRMPIGLAGPLRVNGLAAKGDYPLPLATTEAALVASYHRGCRVINESGGCTTLLLSENVSRAPAFLFSTASDGARFVIWVMARFEELKQIAESTTAHGKLIDLGCILEGNHVYLNFEYITGDASGQNMVTIATQAACDWIMQESPMPPQRYYVESNMSGDKKASAKSFTTVRGKKVTAEVRVSAEVLEKLLHVTAREMEEYWRVSAIGGVLSGTMGVHGHFANGLAALYLATGQDVACVAESATGLTRFEARDDGSLYAVVTLPGIMVGTVGGGTGLPTQRACLELMGLHGSGQARALAEVCAGLLLAGELSIIAAMSAGHFARAHHKLARSKKTTDS
jgi:hydroxymethylglutaryl-CoA reductase (NADPH)